MTSHGLVIQEPDLKGKGKAWAIKENNKMEVDPATIPLPAEAGMAGNTEGKPEEQELMDYPNKPPAAKS
ncbi:hypothetical protein C0995_009492, partial [Termitomyces sp. Mi166